MPSPNGIEDSRGDDHARMHDENIRRYLEDLARQEHGNDDRKGNSPTMRNEWQTGSGKQRNRKLAREFTTAVRNENKTHTVVIRMRNLDAKSVAGSQFLNGIIRLTEYMSRRRTLKIASGSIAEATRYPYLRTTQKEHASMQKLKTSPFTARKSRCTGTELPSADFAASSFRDCLILQRTLTKPKCWSTSSGVTHIRPS